MKKKHVIIYHFKSHLLLSWKKYLKSCYCSEKKAAVYMVLFKQLSIKMLSFPPQTLERGWKADIKWKNLNLYQIHNYVVIQMTFCLFSALAVKGNHRIKAPTVIWLLSQLCLQLRIYGYLLAEKCVLLIKTQLFSGSFIHSFFQEASISPWLSSRFCR